MTPAVPDDIVGELVRVLNGELWRVGVRTDLNAEFIELDIGELIEPRVFEITCGCCAVVSVKAQTKLIRQVWREAVKLGRRREVVSVRRRKVERRKLRFARRIEAAFVIRDDAPAQLIL